MLNYIRILLAIAAYYDDKIWQISVKTAFLNGYINKEIYIKQPKGFKSSDEIHKVCNLENVSMDSNKLPES